MTEDEVIELIKEGVDEIYIVLAEMGVENADFLFGRALAQYLMENP